MLEELEYNLWEHILSRLVDYGHAFSPEIEMAALQGDEALLLHGEAVNIDMALTTQVCTSFHNLVCASCTALLLMHCCILQPRLCVASSVVLYAAWVSTLDYIAVSDRLA